MNIRVEVRISRRTWRKGEETGSRPSGTPQHPGEPLVPPDSRNSTCCRC